MTISFHVVIFRSQPLGEIHEFFNRWLRFLTTGWDSHPAVQKNLNRHTVQLFMILFNGILRDFSCKNNSIIFKYKVHVSNKNFQLIAVYWKTELDHQKQGWATQLMSGAIDRQPQITWGADIIVVKFLNISVIFIFNILMWYLEGKFVLKFQDLNSFCSFWSSRDFQFVIESIVTCMREESKFFKIWIKIEKSLILL